MRTFLITAAMVLVSSLLGLAAAELILRQFPEYLPEEAGLRLHWRNVTMDAASVSDPEIGFLYRPGITHEIARSDLRFVMQTDARGFRNRDPWPARSDIVVLGDSMAVGYGVEYDETWVSRLARAQSTYSFTNLGLIGASPPQYARIFDRFGAPLAPRVVLFCLFPGNDVADSIDFDDWQRHGAGTTYEQWRGRSGSSSGAFRIGDVLQSSYVAMFVAYSAKTLVTARELRAQTLRLSGGGKLTVTPGIYEKITRLAQPGSPGLERVMDAIRHTQERVSGNGGKLVVLLFPTKSDVYLPLFGKNSPETTRPFVHALEQAGIRHLDLTPHLQQGARGGAQLYFEIDGHPNTEGYALVARAVDAHLRAQRFDLGIAEWR